MQDVGCRMQDAGCKMQDARCRMQDAGCKMLDAGCRMLDAGCRMQDVVISPPEFLPVSNIQRKKVFISLWFKKIIYLQPVSRS
jgi:hypothetical protein